MKTSSTPNRLLAYGSLALGSTTILATRTDAATVVNVNNTTYSTGLPGIGTIAHDSTSGYLFDNPMKGYTASYLTFSTDVVGNGAFLRSSDVTPQVQPTIPIASQFSYGSSGEMSGPSNNAELNSSSNWLYVNAADDSTQRLWVQFAFGDGSGSGFSIVKAVIPGEGETIDNAAAAASAVPEPSALVLLSLGATGLLARRRRQAA